MLDAIKPYAAGIALVGAFLAGAVVNGWRLDGEKAAAVSAKEAEMKAACEETQRKTQGVSRDYQNQLAALRAQLDAFRVQPTRCVPVSHTSGGRDGAAEGNQPARSNAVADLALYELAAEGEQYRLQLIACQALLTE